MSAVDVVKKNYQYSNACSLIEIEEAEKELNLKFADEYKQVLLECGKVSNEYLDLSSPNNPLADVVNTTKEVRKLYRNLPRDCYVLVDVGVDGIYVLQDGRGKLFDIDEDDEIYQSYPNLETYLEKMSK